MIEKIYFDMDGVPADVDGGLTKLCGLTGILHFSSEDTRLQLLEKNLL